MLDETLTMIPGPTPVHPRILDALSQPTTSHVAPGFVEVFQDCLKRLCQVAQTQHAQPFLVSGAGTLAMEMALVNVVAPGERLLIVSQGYFGDRYAELAEALGLEFDRLAAAWGDCVAPDELKAKLSERSYAAVAMTHVDTSTGAAAPIRDYCSLLSERDELAIVDGVCATAGMDEPMDAWGMDILLTGAQKAFGAPPGLAILFASPAAMQRRRQRPSIQAYYADFLRWEPIMHDPGKYFSTPPVNQIRATHVAVGLCLEEGLQARFARHRRTAAAIRAALRVAGLQSVTQDHCLADTLSVVAYPQGLDDAQFRAGLAAQQVVVAPALGPLAGKAFRVGHMGNIGTGDVYRLLQAVEDSCIALGRQVEPGSLVAAAGAQGL